ncbi:MAG: hypothetical protein Q4A32_00990 [Lachnospiraceae bacterium]|nr:hypothetical protein [Lachnospiraceae bacterium]
MYDIRYKNQTGKSHGVYVMKRPAIPAPNEEVEMVRVAGRDGVLTGDRYLQPIELYISMNFRETEAQWAAKYREVKKWLSGSGKLEQVDDQDYFYKVYQVQIEENERIIKRYGAFTAHFTCDPYMYVADGAEEYAISNERILSNAYEECHPIYIVTGSGTRTLTVNGKTATLTVNGTTVVDTERMITYTQADHTLRNTRLTGNYEDLYLVPGANTISASASGVTIIPNWRCR